MTALFFGYTRCPDLCPTTMADLTTAVRELPPGDQEKVTVVFVSEDPGSDTPVAVREWLDHSTRTSSPTTAATPSTTSAPR